MYLQEKRIEYYSELLGRHRPDIQLKLETYKRFPKLADRIESELFGLLKLEGFDIIDLPDFPCPCPDDLKNEGIHVGYFIEKGKRGRPFYIPLAAFDGKHTLIAGKTGSGKTYLGKILFYELTKKGIPVILFDEQNEAADLVKILGVEKVSIINPFDLKLPLLMCPPNCDYESYYGLVKSIFRECFYMKDGSLNLMDELRDYLARKGNKYPSVADFFNLIKSWRTNPMSRERGFIETLYNRFRSHVGGPFDGREGHRIEKLEEDSSIIQTGLITDSYDRNFYMNQFLTWFRFYRMNNPSTGPSVVLILEESHRYFFKKNNERADLSEPMMYQMVRECRKAGISLVLIDQNPDKLPSQVLANISNWFAFSLPDSRDVKTMCHSMGIE
jgi:hypothetical protein